MSRAQTNVLASLVLLALYAGAIGTVGFFVSSFAYLVAHMLLLGIRDWKVLLLVTAGTLGTFYLVVEAFLGVSLPRGILP